MCSSTESGSNTDYIQTQIHHTDVMSNRDVRFCV